MVTIITTYKTACKLWNKTNRREQPWLADWMAAFRHKTIWEPDWRNALEAAVAVTTHERIRLCVLSPLYLMVMDKLSVAYHPTLGPGVWCFSRVTVCWVDRFGLLIAVWWFWYVGCVEQVKSFMQWRLQIAFSCPSLPPLLKWFVWCLYQSIERAWAFTHAPSYFSLSSIPLPSLCWFYIIFRERRINDIITTHYVA